MSTTKIPTNPPTFEEIRHMKMEEQIDSFLKGKMTKLQEEKFIAECKQNKKLRREAYITALLAKTLRKYR